jgi:UDP-glucose 4-epimerase
MRRLRIAVTGTLGVVGSRLIERLDADESCRRLVLLDLVPPPGQLKKARFYRVDLTEPAASARIAEALERERVDVIVHLAFLQHPTRNPSYAHELESLGTMQLLHALRRIDRGGPIPHLVIGSSTLVYGAHSTNPSFLDEGAPLAAPTRYPLVREKIDAEHQVERWHEQTNGAATILRLAPLLSAGIRTLTSRYFSLPAVPTILGFNPMIQTLAVPDAVEAFARAIVHGAAIGGRGPLAKFNVCATGVVPLHTAIHLCGRRAVPLLRFAASTMIDALFQAGLAIAPSAHLDYVQYPCVADGARAGHDLGFVPVTTTRDCLAEFGRTMLRAAA